ncbi:MAG: copper chaperone PCu(A)C [Pseudomonadota bacterium]
MTSNPVLGAALALCLSTLTALPALAQDLVISDAYARSSSPVAKSGAAFMVIENTGTTADRLIAAKTDAAVRAELHTHKDAGNGVMQMLAVEDGFEIPAGGKHRLARGGDHVMLMGLTAPMAQDDLISMTLVFENAGEIVLEIPVDLERKPAAHNP